MRSTIESDVEAGSRVSPTQAKPVPADRIEPSRRGVVDLITPYIAIARPDYWFKNVFMAIGVFLAYFYYPALLHQFSVWPLLVALVATCLIASTNYVINEILDAPTDESHPTKRNRPIPSGRARVGVAYVEWVLLGVVGLSVAYSLN